MEIKNYGIAAGFIIEIFIFKSEIIITVNS